MSRVLNSVIDFGTSSSTLVSLLDVAWPEILDRVTGPHSNRFHPINDNHTQFEDSRERHRPVDGSLGPVERGKLRYLDVASQELATVRSADALTRDAYRDTAEGFARVVKPSPQGRKLSENGTRESRQSSTTAFHGDRGLRSSCASVSHSGITQ